MASLLAGATPVAFAAAFQTAVCFPRQSPCLFRPRSLPPFSSSTSLSTLPSSTLPLIYCGRGDKKTAKGKRFNHSFGNARPKDKKKGRGPPRVAVPPAPPRKDRYDDGEVVKIEIDESLG